MDQFLWDVATGRCEASGDVSRPETLGDQQRGVGRLPRERSNSDNLFECGEDGARGVGVLQRKLEEGTEVVGAVSAQLVDYKQIVVVLQGQLRRGKPTPKTSAVEA